MKKSFLWLKGKRRKPWRKIRTEAEKSIRRLCLGALVLETAWGIRTYGNHMIYHEYSVTELEEGRESLPEGKGRKTWGLSIEWKEGKMRIYWQNEYWKEDN